MKGIGFYDDPEILARYILARSGPDEGNSTLEEPAVLRFLGDVRGGDVLDLGCGDARIGTHLLEGGAASYLGIEGSFRMVERARQNLAGSAGEVRLADLETWEGEPGAIFDTVISRMAFHYIRELERLLSVIRKMCSARSRLIFSVEHPVVTCSYQGDFVDGIPRSWSVSGYFLDGERDCEWLGATVHKYHRSFETYFSALERQGFRIETLAEGNPDPALFRDSEVYRQRREVPMYAIFSAAATG